MVGWYDTSGPAEASHPAPLCETGFPPGQPQNAEDTPKSLTKTRSASGSSCEVHFFASSRIKTQHQSRCVWNDRNNVFHGVPPLGGRGEDKEVSHVVYCRTGKWLMVGNVTDEWGQKTRRGSWCSANTFLWWIGCKACIGEFSNWMICHHEIFLKMLSRFALSV